MRSLPGLLLLPFLAAPAARAAPPLLIGDAPTADRGQIELYAGAAWQKSGAGELALPGVELVIGVSGWQELTVEAPLLLVEGQRGLGDLVLGTKVRLVEEAAGRPGLAASLEWKLANGDRAAGLGSGAMEAELRLRVQKTWDRVTLIGNAGYTLVGEPEEAGVRLPRRNTGLLGLGAEVVLREGVRLVGDAFWRSADVAGDPARVAGDLGLKLQVAPGLALHGAVGRSLRPDQLGGPALRLYGGLKWEFALF